MSNVIAKICDHLKLLNSIRGVFTHMPQNPTLPYITLDLKNIQRGQGNSNNHLCHTEHIYLKIFSGYQGIKEILNLTNIVMDALEMLNLEEESQFVALKVNDAKLSSLKDGTHMVEFYVDILIKN